MHKAPKFSVIVPIYNVGRYLSPCLGSVIQQTLKDIEIICVNDGSTDDSLAAVQRYREVDDRIQIVDKENGGLSSARNAGLERAKGRYILFVDPDDHLDLTACDRLYTEFEQTHADMVVFGSIAFPEHAAMQDKWLVKKLIVRTRYYHQDTVMALFHENVSVPFVWNKCYKSDLIKKNGISFNERLRYGEDTPFLFRIFPKAREISFISDKLYHYRCNSQGSLMSRARRDPEWKLGMHVRIVEDILGHWQKGAYMERVMDELYRWILAFVLTDLENEDIAQDCRKKCAQEITELVRASELRFSRKERLLGYGMRLEKRLGAVAGMDFR